MDTRSQKLRDARGAHGPEQDDAHLRSTPADKRARLGPYSIRKIETGDRSWIDNVLREHWGSPAVVTRGKVHHANELPGFVARGSSGKIGLITYSINGTECEVVTLDSLAEGRGIGSTLLKAVESAARESGCTCLRLVTTNDNLKALRFYQKRGFNLVALHVNAVAASRKLKPEIPATGIDGIPIRHELEMEIVL